MPLIRLSYKTIPEFEPGIVAAFEQYLKLAALDCEDRPADDKARKVTLDVLMTPVFDKGSRDCAGVLVRFECHGKVPKHATKETTIALRKNGILVGNPDSPDDPDQQTFDMDEK